MIPSFSLGSGLGQRSTTAVELMDDPNCDLAALRRTYARFGMVNRLVAGWRGVYATRLRPLLSASRTTTLLDLGCGGGDVAAALSGWAEEDGFRLDVLGVDPDPRAYAFLSERAAVARVRFRQADSGDLVRAGEQFDVVVSNHLLHHLAPAELADVLADGERLATRLVLHNDLRRSWLAYVGWAALSWPAAADSFLFTDGLRSIRRSYRADELAAVAPSGWRVESQPPFRLLLSWRPGA